MSASWKVGIDCTQAEAEAAELEEAPLSAHERDGERWRLEAYLAERPAPDFLARFARLAPSAAGSPTVERVAPVDWVRLSQAALPPVRAGRFLVHTRAHAQARRPGDIALRIEAGQAFGTGQHATTLGCLAAIDRLARRRARPSVLDLGTGTGVLALAAAKRWRRARVVASDIDPVATATAHGNARDNGLAPGRIAFLTAAGLHHRRLRGGRFALVLANILAGPLVAMAGPVARAVAPGGRLVLAGLLAHQAAPVIAAYRARGLTLVSWPRRAGWPVLEFTRPQAR